MEAFECTHCQVAMTSWMPAGSSVRYFQCPLCARTHSSFYDEVFRARAGARRAGVPVHHASPEALPMASLEEQRWAAVRLRAARWFARLEAEALRAARALPAPAQRVEPLAVAAEDLPARHR